jgi:hypothetical protein
MLSTLLQFLFGGATEKQDVLYVTLENCLERFDERLFPVLWVELKEVLQALKKVEGSQQFLLELSAECRTGGVNLSVSQSNRVSKMCEMIESIPLVPYPASFPADFLEGSAKVPVISSARCLCPEADLLSAYVAKMRSKLKLIDDMAASKKSDSIRFKYQRQSIGGYSSPLSSKLRAGQVYDCSLVRDECKQFFSALEALESSLQQSVEVLTYASSLKQKIHRPFLELQSVVTQLPPLTDVEDNVIQSRKDFEQAEAEYQEHRTHNAILLNVSSLQQELHGVSRDIESFLDKYMSTVGAMTTTGDHKQQSFGEDDVRQLLSCLTKVFAKCGEEPVVISEEDRDILRLLFLEPLLVHWQSTLRKPKSAVVGSNPSSKLTGETLTAVFLKRYVVSYGDSWPVKMTDTVDFYVEL